MSDRPCISPGCRFHPAPGKRYCGWHRLDRMSIEEQEKYAQLRIAVWEASVAPHRARVKTAEGSQWCSGCQTAVPDFYASGSKCKACARRSRRASHVERTYNISAEEERALYAWQDGRCFVCGRKARTRQLAVDHDHVTGEVRGLLCSDDKFGCNVLLRRILGDLAAADRLVAYVMATPLERMRAGDEPWQWHPRQDAISDSAPPF